jgi:hypothetical protein
MRGHQLHLLDPSKNAAPRATLTRPEVRAALRKVLEPKFNVVVGNPPYITEHDSSRREYHRQKVGRRRRYISAYREYSLGAPFTERSFQLAVPRGFVGLIVGNNFMKREFGKALIEQVLSDCDLNLVVDTAHAQFREHGTSTLMIFGRNRLPHGDTVRVVMGKRGETASRDDGSGGRVWASILEGWNQIDFEDPLISVADLPRAVLCKHPWSFAAGGAAPLKERLDSCAVKRLRDLAEIGTGTVTREDEVYRVGRASALRMGVPADQTRPLVEGDAVRDWSIRNATDAIWPYDPESLQSVTGPTRFSIERLLWPWKARLARRVAYGRTQIEQGRRWFEYSMFFTKRARNPLSLAFAFIASHNHFVLDYGGKVSIVRRRSSNCRLDRLRTNTSLF